MTATYFFSFSNLCQSFVGGVFCVVLSFGWPVWCTHPCVYKVVIEIKRQDPLCGCVFFCLFLSVVCVVCVLVSSSVLLSLASCSVILGGVALVLF